MALAPMQQRFVEEYLVDLNGKQAAIRAGYSARTAAVQAAKMLTIPNLAAAVAEGKAARSIRAQITADNVLREIARVAFADLRQVATWGKDGITVKASTELSDDVAAAVSEVSATEHGPKIKLHDKLGALKQLANHLGLSAPERVEHSGAIEVSGDAAIANARMAAFVAGIASRAEASGLAGDSPASDTRTG